LETLSISSENINRFHIDISKIPTLKELVLDNHNPSISNIGKAKQLEVIVLYNYRSDDLREFKQLTELHDLRLYYSHIKSLDGIENFTKLEYLDIAWAKNLQDIYSSLYDSKTLDVDIEKREIYGQLDNYKFTFDIITRDIKSIQNLETGEFIKISLNK